MTKNEPDVPTTISDAVLDEVQAGVSDRKGVDTGMKFKIEIEGISQGDFQTIKDLDDDTDPVVVQTGERTPARTIKQRVRV